MKIQLKLWPATFFILAWIHIMSCMNTHSVSRLCLDDQKSSLLQLQNSLQFNHPLSTKLAWWNETSTDCCQWSGVECDCSTGHVIGLDLSDEGISGPLHNSSSLFRLRFLQSLNLAFNYDITGKIPSAIGKLTSLTYLNMSNTGFSGQAPIEISHLLNLLILDISMTGVTYSPLPIKNPNLAMILKNLTNIRELHLDGVPISAKWSEWCEAISSSLPHLQVLSMSQCDLTGEIHHSLEKLHSLSMIDLDYNYYLSGPVPEFLGGFKNLTMLSLSNCGLLGAVPDNIFQVSTLKSLDLSGNYELQGTLPNFVEGGSSLQKLVLEGTSFSGMLPHSIGNLKMLQTIDLSRCQFHGIIPQSMGSLNLLEEVYLNDNNLSGPIPPSMESLNLLEYVDLSNNNFYGSIPSFSSAKKLWYLDLSNNSLSGSITTIDWGGLLDLQYIDLSMNSLTGSIPASLLSLPSLQHIYLEHNKFSGQLNEFAGLSTLRFLHLQYNNLEGPVPKSVFELRGLVGLHLSGNKFNGTLELNDILHSLINLTHLSLSHNSLSIDANGPTPNSLFPKLSYLSLGTCNLRILPEFLKNQSTLEYLDLSKNQIQGKVPAWIWNVSFKFSYLNLSCNNFVDLEQPLSHVDLGAIDLHSNNLQGQIGAFPLTKARYLDFSNNSFTSINPNIGDALYLLESLVLSRNKIQGSIPLSLCKAALTFLDLEYNHLNGTIPNCLIAMSSTLLMLNLRGNNLQGVIPDAFGEGCALESFKANMNFLHGRIPRSLTNCQYLNVLDLGNNGLNDTFPCHLESLPSLQVLILRSNQFHGNVVCSESNSNWPLLQILDLSSNHFNGQLSTLFLGKWGKMMVTSNENLSELSYMEYYGDYGGYYDGVAITFKGSRFLLQKILTIFTTIDLSNNSFDGEIPKEVWNMVGLKVLDLSHNSLSGSMPSSIRNLSQLESLDLCCNNLSGNIPQQLTSLNYLEYLNLSFNKLEGLIPKSTQLQSFDASSYEGNPGLYGLPLTLIDRDRHAPDQLVPPTPNTEGSSYWSSKNELEWILRGAEVGLPVGIIIFIGPLLYIKRWRQWYYYHVDRRDLCFLFLGIEKLLQPMKFSTGSSESSGRGRGGERIRFE